MTHGSLPNAIDRARPHGILAALGLFAATCLVPGCLVDDTYPLPEDFGTCEPAEDDAGEPALPEGPITYYSHAKPIIDAKCAGCHNEGGIGPFALETFDDAFIAQQSTRSAILDGTMPPWQPDDCCNDYLHDRSLSDQEMAILTAWIDQGGLPGDPAAEGDPIDFDRGGLSRVDVTVTMPEPFTPMPLIGRDEIRCFVLDWPADWIMDDEVYVRGLDVIPGDRSMVHHVVVATVPRKTADDLREREAEDDRPGWDCYGEIGGDIRETVILGGWAPGYQGVEMPDGLGKKVPEDHVLILNMHYDTGSGISQDQTSVELMVTEEPTREMLGSAVMNPLWLVGGGMSIPADDPDTMVYFSWDPTVLTRDEPFEIYAVNIHMHELGSIGRLAILREDGSVDCLLNITRWDFDWIGEYYLEEPVILEPGDQLFVECHFDNTAANQKIVDGELETPRDIAWGTDQEMCAAVVGIAEL